MTVDQIVQMNRADPFQPYRIHMAKGRSLDVIHRDFVARSPAGRTIIVYKPDESFEVVDVLLVASLEVINGNGQASG